MPTIAQLSGASGVRRRRRSSRRKRHVALPTFPFPVFIAYADVPAARHAMNHFATMLRLTNPAYRLQPMLWRFDQLDREPWRKMALADATQAWTIVIALSDAANLNAAVETWLKALAERHRDASVNVVAVLSEESWMISLQRSNTQSVPRAKQQVSPKENPTAFSTLPDKKVPACAA